MIVDPFTIVRSCIRLVAGTLLGLFGASVYAGTPVVDLLRGRP